MKTFFDIPTQVKFKVIPDCGEEENNLWICGIAYHDIIICACCGGAFEMDEICEIVELPWVDFTDEFRE